jgi:PHD/YefM family antitoxin component YafN of YafNO toxin-antitoxin module
VPITTMSAREFNQDVSKAKKAASDGLVFVTDRGRPSHVLLTIAEYQSIAGTDASIIDLLAMPAAESIEIDIPRLGGPVANAVDFS